MNIGIDCGALSVKDDKLKVGVYQFNLDLIRSLSKIDKNNKYLLYSFYPLDKDFLYSLSSNFVNKVIKPKVGWLNLRLSGELFINKPDIFIGMSQALPLYHPKRSIVIVYDLAFEFFPDCYKDSYQRLHFQTKKAVDGASEIIAVSNSTKEDLIKIYKVPEKKVKVIYPAVNEIFSPVSENEQVKILKKYNLDKKYLLFVGSLKPIKNIVRILDAYNNLSSIFKKEYKLVLIGSDHWSTKEIRQKCLNMQKNNELKYLGFVPREELPALFTGATAFVSPSLYEGFGFPLLEAMSCSCPVITGTGGSMPEVVGDAALKTNPFNVNEISKAMINITKSKSLRERLIDNGFKRIKQFKWDNFAEELIKVLGNKI